MLTLWIFLAGAFLANGVPHFVKGVTGQTHMTPFKRVSSPVINVVWGVVNFTAGLYLANMAGGVSTVLTGSNLWVFLTGALVTALACASLFGKPNAKLPWQKD